MATYSLGNYRRRKSFHIGGCNSCGALSGSGFTETGGSIKINNLDEFLATLNFNPHLGSFFAVISVWQNMGAPSEAIVQMIESTPCVGQVLLKAIKRGSPTDNTLSALERLSQTIAEAVIGFLKKAGVQKCAELLAKLSARFSGSAFFAPLLEHVAKIGSQFLCQAIIDFLDQEVFRKFVVPFLNNLIGFQAISGEVGGVTFFGSNSAEKQEIESCKQQLQAKSSIIQELIKGGGTPVIPPIDPISPPISGDLFGGNVGSDNANIDGKTVLIASSALVVVAIAFNLYNNRETKTSTNT